MSVNYLMNIDDPAPEPRSIRVYDLHLDGDIIRDGEVTYLGTVAISRFTGVATPLTNVDTNIVFGSQAFAHPGADLTWNGVEFISNFSGFVRIEFNGYADINNVAETEIRVEIRINGNVLKVMAATGAGGGDPNWFVGLDNSAVSGVVPGDTISVTIRSDQNTGTLEPGAGLFITRLTM